MVTELDPDQRKKLDLLFHSKDYGDLYKILSGLRNIADHLYKKVFFLVITYNFDVPYICRCCCCYCIHLVIYR